MRPSAQAASTRLYSEIVVHPAFTLPEPLLGASYCMLFCSSAVTTTACSTAAVVLPGYEPCGGGDSESTMSSPSRKGMVIPIQWAPNQYHGWNTLQRVANVRGRARQSYVGRRDRTCNTREICYSAAEDTTRHGDLRDIRWVGLNGDSR